MLSRAASTALGKGRDEGRGGAEEGAGGVGRRAVQVKVRRWGPAVHT